jgi:hypothetical protein
MSHNMSFLPIQVIHESKCVLCHVSCPEVSGKEEGNINSFEKKSTGETANIDKEKDVLELQRRFVPRKKTHNLGFRC